MVILVVDDRKPRLEQLVDSLKQFFAKETVLYYSDPLLAGKYAFFNSVDVLFSALNMHRLNGIQLKKMVHYVNADAKVILTGEEAEFDEADVLDAYGKPAVPGVDGVLFYPLKEQALLELMQKKDPLRSKANSDEPKGMRTIEEVYEELLRNDDLKQQLVRAALDDCLESFFEKAGCAAKMDEIQMYFQRRMLQRKTFSEEQLEEVQGGIGVQQGIRRLILAWAG